LLEAPFQLRVDFRKHPAREVAVNVIADGSELVLRNALIHRHHSIAHHAIARHHDHQHALVSQGDQFDLVQRLARRRDGRRDTHAARHFRKHVRGPLDASLHGAQLAQLRPQAL